MNHVNSQNYQTLLNKYANYIRTTLKPKLAKLEAGFEAQLPLPHKTFNILFLVLAIIFVGILVSVYIWFRPLPRRSPSGVGGPSSSPTTSSSTPGLYQNSEYGLKLKYPAIYAEFKPDMPYYRLPSVLLAVKSDQHQYQAPNYLQDSYLTVAFDPDSSGCGAPKDGWDVVSLNGTNFSHRANTSAGAGSQYHTDFYRTAIKDKCFEIITIVQVNSNFDGIDMKASGESVLAAKTDLSQILSAFTINP